VDVKSLEKENDCERVLFVPNTQFFLHGGFGGAALAPQCVPALL
jgi:hypothetical protein